MLLGAGLTLGTGAGAALDPGAQLVEQVLGHGRLGRLQDHVLQGLIGDVLVVLVLALVWVGGWRLGGRLLLRGRFPRRQAGGTGGQDQAGGGGHVLLGHLVAPGQGGGEPGDADGQQRAAQGGDAQGQGGGAQGLDEGIADGHRRQPGPGGRDLRRTPGDRHLGVMDAETRQVEMEGQAVTQGFRQMLVLPHPLVQGDDTQAGVAAGGDTIPLQDHLTTVEDGGEVGGGGPLQALGHGQFHHPAIGLGEEATLGHGPAGAQGGSQIEPAQQAALADMERNLESRAAGGQQAPGQFQPAIPHRPGQGAQDHPSRAGGVDGEQGRGQGGILPGGDQAGSIGISHIWAPRRRFSQPQGARG